MRGTGERAALIGEVFRVARARAGISDGYPELSTRAFRRQGARHATLFD